MTSDTIAHVNARGRIQCGPHEFSSGQVVDVLIGGAWHTTRIEFDFDGKRYYSVDDLPLVGHAIRYAED